MGDIEEGLAWMSRTAHGRVGEAVRAVCERDTGLADHVVRGDSQLDTAKDRLQHYIFRRLEDPALPQPEREFLRAAIFISQNLERIGDCAADIAKQARQLGRHPLADGVRRLLMETVPVIGEGIERSLKACLRQRLDDARAAMTYEDRLDRVFGEGMAVIRERPAPPDPNVTVTTALLLKYVENIGDYIQNITDQAIFLITGQRLKYSNLVELERVLGRGEEEKPAFSFQNLFEGRSGARVGRVEADGWGSLFFKQDQPEKIGEEIRKMREWNDLVPGIVPRLRGQSDPAEATSFVAEFLDCILLRDLFLDQDDEIIGKALSALFATLREAWERSLRRERVEIDYVAQIRARLEDLFRMHPGLRKTRGQTVRFDGATMPSLDETLDALEARQQRLAPPVSVWIHGDFNVDNVFYDIAEDRVYFIDVHRSGRGDYVRDMSVFMVSNIRNPMLPARVLRRMMAINESAYSFARSFAEGVGDANFEARMRLARGRALITSARLIADKRFARRLFLQGMYLLDCVVGEETPQGG